MTRQQSASSSSKTTHSRRRFLRAASAAGLLGVAGCIQQTNNGGGGGGNGGTGGGGGNGGTGGGGGNGNIGTVTFGVLNPISGPFSSLGKPQRQAAKLGVEYVNNSDEFDFEIEAIYEDTQTDPAVATQKARKLVKQDGASFLAGAANSAVGLALADFAKGQQVVYTSGGAAMELTGKNCNAYTFRNETNTAMQAAGLVDFAAKELGTKWWMHTANYAYGNSAIQQIKRRLDAEGYGVEIVGTTKPKPGTDNFGPYISQIANSDAEVLAIPLTGGDLIKFMKQASSRGLKKQVEIIGTALFAEVIRSALGKAAANTYSATLYNYKLETGDNEQFVDSYRNAYGNPPGSFARVGYENVRMIARGIQFAGSADPAKVKDALPGKNMTTILGQRKFRTCDHQAITPVWTGKIVAADSGTNVKLLNKISGKNATPPCGTGNCSL